MTFKLIISPEKEQTAEAQEIVRRQMRQHREGNYDIACVDLAMNRMTCWDCNQATVWIVRGQHALCPECAAEQEAAKALAEREQAAQAKLAELRVEALEHEAEARGLELAALRQ